MKKVIANVLMVLAIFHLVVCLCSLFHIIGVNLENKTYDKISMITLFIGMFYGYVSLLLTNQLNRTK